MLFQDVLVSFLGLGVPTKDVGVPGQNGALSCKDVTVSFKNVIVPFNEKGVTI